MNLSEQLEEALLVERSVYRVPSPAQLKAKLSGKGGGLTKFMVAKLRKDFLTLMKNLKVVKNYDEAEQVKNALFMWRDHYEDIISQIKPEIDGLLRIQMTQKSWQRKVNEKWAKDFRDNQKPIWMFRSSLWDFPLERPRGKRTVSDESKEIYFREYQRTYKMGVVCSAKVAGRLEVVGQVR